MKVAPEQASGPLMPSYSAECVSSAEQPSVLATPISIKKPITPNLQVARGHGCRRASTTTSHLSFARSPIDSGLELAANPCSDHIYLCRLYEAQINMPARFGPNPRGCSQFLE